MRDEKRLPTALYRAHEANIAISAPDSQELKAYCLGNVTVVPWKQSQEQWLRTASLTAKVHCEAQGLGKKDDCQCAKAT